MTKDNFMRAVLCAQGCRSSILTFLSPVSDRKAMRSRLE